jgi:UDP-glucose 4-epimerase
MSTNIMITGDLGYIGSFLKGLLSSYYNIIGYDIVNGDDIMDYEKLSNIFKSNKIDIVIHMAALSTVSSCNDDPDLAVKINGVGTHTVLRAMKDGNCKNIIYASTSSVYGNNENLPYTEDMDPSPCSEYGSSKLLGEQYIIDDENIENYIIFRMFNVIGSKSNVAIGNLGYDRLFGALVTGNVTVYGKDYPTEDGTCERDYVSLKDTCRAYLLGIRLIHSNTKIRKIINLCSNKLSSVDSIITTWNNINFDKQKLGPCLSEVVSSYGNRRLGDPAKVYGSNTAANKILGWKPEQTMEDIITDFITIKPVEYESVDIL